jgi:hypothetical protein
VADDASKGLTTYGQRRGAEELKSYRVYILEPDGRLQLGQAFEAADDGAAGGQAARAAEPGKVAELWEGGRIVGKVSAAGVFTAGG